MEEANERDWVTSIEDVLVLGGVKAGKYSFGNPCINSVEGRSNLVTILQMLCRWICGWPPVGGRERAANFLRGFRLPQSEEEEGGQGRKGDSREIHILFPG